jgi:hypothetical protein
MSLEDIIQFLVTETERHTLTEMSIRRCVLLAHEMGRHDAQAGLPAGSEKQ